MLVTLVAAATVSLLVTGPGPARAQTRAPARAQAAAATPQPPRAADATTAWERLDGITTATAAPAVAADPTDPAGAYALSRGDDFALWWTHETGGTWSTATTGGGVLGSAPVAIADRTGLVGPASVYVFVRGYDGGLYVGQILNGTWQGWQDLGGSLDFEPAVAIDATGLWVAVRGVDGGLYARRLRDGAWSQWFGFGGYLDSSPSLAADSTGVHAFVTGGDLGLYEHDISGGEWRPLGGLLTSAPSATADPGGDGTSVVVRGGDGAAYWTHGSGDDWTPYAGLGGYLMGQPSTTTDATGVSVYVRGGDAGLYRGRIAQGAWQGWTPEGGFLASDPVAATDDVGFDHVVVVGGDDALYTMAVASGSDTGPLFVSTDPVLFPSFDPAVTDYVSRCHADEPVEVSVHAPTGTTVSVDGGPPASGSFTASVTRDVGRSFSFVTRTGAQVDTYDVRCLPEDFPTWTAQRTGPTQAEYYVLDGAFAKYVAIVDTDGVPIWWNVVPDLSVFADLLPDGRFGWITYEGTVQELPLVGDPISTVVTPDPPFSIDNHDFVQLPDGHHLVVANRAVADVDLRAWGSPYTTGPVLDHVVEELDDQGAVVWSWDALDHIPVTETNAQFRGATTTCALGTCDDVFHWNAMEPTVEPNGDPGLVLSFRHLDAVLNVDRTTGAIVWRLGGVPRRVATAGTTVTGTTAITAADAAFTSDDVGAAITDTEGRLPAGSRITAVSSPTSATVSQPATGTTSQDTFTLNPQSLSVLDDPVFSGGSHFGGQHDARVLADGTVTLYDDGTDLGRSPRAVRYRIDPAAMTATLVESVDDPGLVPASFCCGSARKLAGGNWVVGWGGTNYVSEMTPAGERVFVLRMVSAPFLYRAIPVPFGRLDRAALRAAMDAKPAGGVAGTSITAPPGRFP